MTRALVALLACILLTGCGQPTEVREPDLVIRDAATSTVTPAPGEAGGAPDSSRTVRIAVVTHGQASDAFWAVVRNGIEAARRQVGVSVTYRAPDVYSVPRMRALIDEAVARRPDGLVVSIPSPAVAPSIRRAVKRGIPVVSINSGGDVSRGLGIRTHVGQPEYRAGFAAGERLATAGVRNALCVDQEPGNDSLATRCRALARALRQFGGRSRVLEVDFQDVGAAQQQVFSAVHRGDVDGVLTLNTAGAEAALRAVQGTNVFVGTFDLSPAVLEAVRTGRLLFAIDQQPYLQGYLPIILLTQFERYGLFPEISEGVASGPNFVTRTDAAQAIRLSKSGIR